jgi:alkylation response protein AidB-like acyl-CoA dehydrogenase
MLIFDISEAQQILRDSVRDFAENEIKPVAEKLDEEEEFSLDLVKKMAGLGLFGMFVSEEYGGSDVG